MELNVKRNIESSIKSLSSSQLERFHKISSRSVLFDVFHHPVPNNFSFLLFSKRASLEEEIRRLAGDTHWLNVASCRVKDFYRELFDLNRGKFDGATEGIVTQLFEAWNRAVDRRNHFLGVEYLTHLHECFLLSGIDQHLPESIAQAIVDLPVSFVTFGRLCIVASEEVLERAVEECVSGLVASTIVGWVIERIEISKDVGLNNPSSHPNLTIVFTRPLRTGYWSAVSACVQRIVDFIASPGDGIVLQQKYSARLSDSCAFSQGYTGYKRFLDICGCLDAVYDSKCDHARVDRDWLKNRSVPCCSEWLSIPEMDLREQCRA